MLETSRVWVALCAGVAAGCAMLPDGAETRPATAAIAPPMAPISTPSPAEEAKVAEEAKALVAQAETDVQRARAKRALWQKAWEDLVAARQAAAGRDHARAIRHAKRASELAQLGLEQLAYPAVEMAKRPD